MPRYVVEGLMRGRLYAGASLETALDVLRRDIYQCRVEHGGPTDARLFVDGKPVETAMRPDGTLQVAAEQKRVELPEIEPKRPPKHWQKH